MKVWILLVAMVLLCPYVFAGESYDIDFDVARTQPVYLYEGDEVRFDVLGDTHSIIIEDVSRSSTIVKIDIVPFLNDGDSTIIPGMITLDTVVKIDLDQDDIGDINVALYSISEEGEVHLVLQEAIQIDEVPPVGLVIEDEEPEGNKNWLFPLLAGLVLLALFFLMKDSIFGNGKEIEPKEEEIEEVKSEDDSPEEDKESSET